MKSCWEEVRASQVRGNERVMEDGNCLRALPLASLDDYMNVVSLAWSLQRLRIF